MSSSVTVAANTTLERLDDRLFDAVVQRRMPALDAPARVIANASRGGVAWILTAGLVRLRGRSDKAPPLTVTAGTVGGVYIASMLLARLLKRDRPCHRKPVEPLVECPEGPSFPSDQTAGAFAGASLLARAVPAARVPLYLAAGLVGVARVYCGVHWPSDVAGGAAAGSVVGIAAARAAQ